MRKIFPEAFFLLLMITAVMPFPASAQDDVRRAGLSPAVTDPQPGFLPRLRKGEEARFDTFVQPLLQERDLSPDSLLVRAALRGVGIPYAEGSIELRPERLTVFLDRTDCILFVESSVAMVQALRSPTPTFETYLDEVRLLRYRDGIPDGYGSRIHYTSEWIEQAASRGILADVSEELGGRRLKKEIRFMSTHSGSYPSLRQDPSAMALVKEAEKRLSAVPVHYIPKKNLRAAEAGIRNGDILCFTSSVAGLDISHLGIALWQEGELTFIHASSTAKKVIVNPTPLSDYLANQRSVTGVRVLRLVQP